MQAVLGADTGSRASGAPTTTTAVYAGLIFFSLILRCPARVSVNPMDAVACQPAVPPPRYIFVRHRACRRPLMLMDERSTGQ